MDTKWRVKYYIPWSNNGAIYVDIAALILLIFCVADGRSLKFNNSFYKKQEMQHIVALNVCACEKHVYVHI